MKFKLARSCAGTVKPVSKDWNSQSVFRRGVDAELVGSSGNRNKLHSCFFIAGAQHLPMRDAGFSVNRIINLVRTVFDVEAEGEFDGSFVTGHFAVEQGDVALFCFAMFKLPRQLTVRIGGQRQHHQAGGIHIEPMHGGLFDAVRIKCFDPADDAVLIFLPFARHGQQAGGLYDNDKLIVLMDDFDGMMEWWNSGSWKRFIIIPLFHYSIVPLFRSAKHEAEDRLTFFGAGRIEFAVLARAGAVFAAPVELAEAERLQAVFGGIV